jgi:hypothetical protein
MKLAVLLLAEIGLETQYKSLFKVPKKKDLTWM